MKHLKFVCVDICIQRRIENIFQSDSVISTNWPTMPPGTPSELCRDFMYVILDYTGGIETTFAADHQSYTVRFKTEKIGILKLEFDQSPVNLNVTHEEEQLRLR